MRSHGEHWSKWETEKQINAKEKGKLKINKLPPTSSLKPSDERVTQESSEFKWIHFCCCAAKTLIYGVTYIQEHNCLFTAVCLWSR